MVMLATTLTAAAAHAAPKSELDCLVRIMHSEAQGESFEGLVVNGQAALNRAKRQGVSVCEIKGVTRKKPPLSMKAYYKALAAALLSKASNSVAKGADSWNTGKKPRQPGEITRVIDHHVYYIAKGD